MATPSENHYRPWFSHFSLHQNHHKYVTTQFAGANPKVADSAGLIICISNNFLADTYTTDQGTSL